MYYTSRRDIEQMVRYTNLEFGREVWAGGLIIEVEVRRLSKTTKGRSVIEK